MSEPTIVCVLGMHRSGTSLAVRLLHALGLSLGPEEHLMGASPANPTGHWENEPINEINDEILSRLGGSWSEPPALPPGWESNPKLDELRHRARDVIRTEFSGLDSWGFKDPRTSLTLPFWQRILPPMRYVICVRNPVDVAFSLKAREEESLPFEQGAELWLVYVRSALAATGTHAQHIVFYEELMATPEPAVRRLANFIGIDHSDAAEAYTRAAIRVAMTEALWHHRTPVPNVIDEPRLPFDIKALYLALRLYAQSTDAVEIEALELLGNYALDARRQRAALRAELQTARAECDKAAGSRGESELRRQAIEAELEAARRELEDTKTRLEEALQSRIDEQRRRNKLSAELEAIRIELAGLRAAARAPDPNPGKPPDNGRRDASYDRLVDEVRARSLELIPSGATVLVASKGDPELVRLDGRVGVHFPTGPGGGYLGYHPSGDTAVIAQLEAMRARGADHLVLPATTIWWLDHYHGLRSHLDDRYARLFRDERCAIYELRGGARSDTTGAIATIGRAAACVRTRTGRDPSVLDWRTGTGIHDHFPELPVFAPPGGGDALPYLDRTVDLVVLAAGDGARVEEARRVAANAVIIVDPNLPEETKLEWVSGNSGGWGEDVCVALIPKPGEPGWDATVTAVADTLGGGFAGELTLVGAGGALGSASERAAAAGARVRLVNVGAQAGFAPRARAAAKATNHRVLVFVAAPAVPLSDWLPPMLSLFTRDKRTGVVGARILSPIGALEEAGGIVAGDGALRHRGQGDENPDRPEYRFVKRVDFCSRPLIATTRSLFERLRGFDEHATDPLVEFSSRAGRAGAPVYYQPQARVVRIGNGDG